MQSEREREAQGEGFPSCSESSIRVVLNALNYFTVPLISSPNNINSD